ncbi:very-short-patch-repair endonuclease [Kitasatospora paracochleata]|uniref:Very-short-patch-repair endonuclease n=1 Tax=Kitasatospora paracochleata TaxID=58354 RepID=A0ABT1J2L9_9ACTN|nr:very-short-patch-repair endonuclease [Kitasatospora paracochleata]
MSVPRRHAGDPDVIGQTAALVGFLREVVQSSHQRLRDTRPWGPLWLADLPAKVPRPSDDDRPLLVLDHVPQAAAPELPPVLEGWVDERLCRDADAEDPPLAEEGPHRTWAPATAVGDGRQGGEEATVARGDAPDVLRAYGSWLTRWRLWAERERSERPQRELYEKVYHWHQQLAQQDDQYELVLAVGLLSWSEPNGAAVHRHVLSRRVETQVDRRTARITVHLTGAGAVRLEDRDFLDTDDGWVPERSAAFDEELSARPLHLLSEETLDCLSQWLDLVLPRPVAFSTNWRPPSGPEAGTRLTFAPALLMRPRDRNAVLGFYDRIAETVVAERHAPLGLAQLVMSLDSEDRQVWGGRQPPELFGDEPLFPGKTNAQQRSVLQRLQRDTGVVVQGPPGTGKTHTIANLVSALLAQGQRVLVTSARDQALTVLRDKLPPAVRDLCVLLLSSTRQDGANELERTINALSDQVAAGDTGQLRDEIRRLTERRYEVRSRIKLLTEQVISLREAEIYQHPEVAPGYSGTLAAIVQKVQDGAVRLNWIGNLPDRSPAAPPLSPVEAEELLALLRDGAGQWTGSGVFRAAGTLPTPGQVATAVAASRLSVHGLSPEAVRVRNQLAALETSVTDGLTELLGSARSRLHRLGIHREAADWGTETWVARALADRLGRRNPELWRRVADVAGVLSEVTDDLERIGLRTVVLPETLTPEHANRLAATVPALTAHLAAGRQLRTWFVPKAQREAEELLNTCRVDGRAPASAEDLRAVLVHLRAHAALAAVAARWDQVGAAVAEAPLEVRLAALRERYRHLTDVDAFGLIREKVDDLLVRHGTYLDLTRPQAWQDFAEAASALAGRQRAEEASARLARWHAILRGEDDGTAPPLEALAMAEALRDGDVDRYTKELEALAAAQRRDERGRRCAELLGALRAASPALAGRLESEAEDPAWDERLGRLREAWAWAQASRFIEDERAPGREQRLDGELTEHEAKLEELTGDLAAAHGRLHCLVRMTSEQRSALQAYRTHMASYGKGKGKNASHFKAAARSAMHIAQGAVPAWVMPIARVAEMIQPQQDAFDVVIVDEASQAGMDALFLLWLAPRIIVVGDDKQCTPPVTGFGRTQQIQDRLTAHLPEVPAHLRQLYMPHSNLYQLLSALFPSTIRLQEHFRCMPEIIGWSSETFYTPPGLIPLRQYGGERLDPLLTHYVEGGVAEGRDGRIRNPREAEAVVDCLVELTADPAYENKTMGAIVLQGTGQVRLLEQLIEQRIPAPVRERHRIRVGTPAQFQGDERHVILLSMVVDRVRRIAGGLRSEQQAYNVAASRAQDQMRLFYSVPPDQLKPGDLRLNLLGYMQNPPAAMAEAADLGAVLPDVRRAPFDSLFEQRVYLRLKEKGYHVVPQYPAGSKRIDLVVVGARGRLGVECDGDYYHSTLEQIRHDHQRDRELQRVGWRFWRVRESEFAIDPDEALAGLWLELERSGIHPADYTRPSASPRPPEDAPAWTPLELQSGDELPDSEPESETDSEPESGTTEGTA